MRRILVSLTVFVVCFVLTGVVAAKTEKELGYRFNTIWSTTVRFVRVDLGYKIIEKDKETGYLLFEYDEEGTKSAASIELIPLLKKNRQMVKLRLQISSMPKYVEGIILDKLTRKLKDEYGYEPFVEYVASNGKRQKEPDADEDQDGGGEDNGDSQSDGAAD